MFTRDNVQAMEFYRNQIKDFEDWIKERLVEYASRPDAVWYYENGTERILSPDLAKRKGWSWWKVDSYWTLESDHIRVDYMIDDERAPTQRMGYANLPWNFVFETEDPEYIEYLRLKARFE